MDITVRRTEPSDAKAVKEVYECKNVYSYTLQLPNPSIELWESRLSRAPDSVYSYVALLDGEIAGNLGFSISTNARRRHVASLGMGVKDSMVGKGVGTALMDTVLDLADNWLNLKRIELTVYVDNERAIDFYKKFGFIVEGESEAYAFKDGEYVNAYHMARIVENR